MLNVALTGNIAAGKSTVVDLFHRWGATIIDADALAREAQAPGGEVLAAIAGRFGADVLASDGTLDRSALRGKVCARHRRAATCSSSTTSPCCSKRSTRPSSMPWSWWTRARRCGARGSAPCADSRTTRPTG
ncbi:MAG: dephospho-CoA kinase [Gemmatimonadetes bacterium]|nr:MAG: dephospho-CoA kinase [Gemmatimonadota bacterium]